ncbi:MAG: DUF2812 domain-containing protein [Oscillospiraceae bacterium]|nr:DUF2812 domain-containing protein [Oscillospiraceae bacterium]
MRKVIRKVFWAWDFDKEEAWLNEMASRGLALVAVDFCKYEFEECAPNEYGIQLELLDNIVSSEESRNYISFVEETGAECVGTWIRWVYFRKKKDGGEFKLFSDKDSLIAHLQRIIIFIAVLGIANLPIGLLNVMLGINTLIEENVVVPNIYLGIFNLVIGIAALAGVSRLTRKKKKLEAERQISE